MLSPSLPQHDPNPEQRATLLAAQASRWPVTYDRFEGLPLAASLSPSDHPSASWLVAVAEVLVKLGVNAAAVDREINKLHPEHPQHHALMELLHDAEKGGIHAAFDFLTGLVQGSDDDVSARSLADYEALFQRLPLPACAASVHDDLWFAQMRLAGPNPMTLARADDLPFSLSPADAQRALSVCGARGIDTSRESLDAMRAEGRLFHADYSSLQGAPGGQWGGRQKYLFGPIALFATVGASRTLVPVAIETDEGVVSPTDGLSWQRAKTLTTIADGNLHQAVIHLAHTHLVTEAIVLAARRTLADHHPLSRLLAPHFEGTLYINDAADKKLAAKGGGVDAVMGGPITFSRQAATSGAQQWSFRGSMLHRDLRSRGVDDIATLPEFPYRDDAWLVQAAIRRWVEGYLRTYYATDASVRDDTEIQAMFRWLAAPDGGRLRDVIPPASTADLIESITHILFTVSAQHAAVNFPQLPIMSYAPAYPLAGYLNRPLQSDADWFELLPPLSQAHYQSTLGFLLGSVHHTVLGTYPTRLFGNFAADSRIDAHLSAFQSDLTAIERIITQRNQSRSPYPFLLPSHIPQSINI